jgi:hypothetical protein
LGDAVGLRGCGGMLLQGLGNVRNGESGHCYHDTEGLGCAL